jgi:hypothetical protein
MNRSYEAGAVAKEYRSMAGIKYFAVSTVDSTVDTTTSCKVLGFLGGRQDFEAPWCAVLGLILRQRLLGPKELWVESNIYADKKRGK